MKKTQKSNDVFTIQKMSDDGLAKLIKDLKKDIERFEFVYTAKKLTGICTKEDFIDDSRYYSYCVFLLDEVKKERKNRKKSANKNELK